MQIALTHKGQAALWVTNGCTSMSNPITTKSMPTGVENGGNGNSVNVWYRISSDIRRFFSFQNNPKDLDPSYKTDLDL